jgi:hypothetical protein
LISQSIYTGEHCEDKVIGYDWDSNLGSFDPDGLPSHDDFKDADSMNFQAICSDLSASSRISKGQGYQGFLRKRAGSSFGQERAIWVGQGKT